MPAFNRRVPGIEALINTFKSELTAREWLAAARARTEEM